MLASGRENKAARQLMVGTDDQWLYTVLHIYHAGVRSVTFWYFCGVKEHPHNTSGSCRRISELCQTVFEFFFVKNNNRDGAVRVIIRLSLLLQLLLLRMLFISIWAPANILHERSRFSSSSSFAFHQLRLLTLTSAALNFILKFKKFLVCKFGQRDKNDTLIGMSWSKMPWKSDRDEIWQDCSSNKYASIAVVESWMTDMTSHFQYGGHDFRPLAAACTASAGCRCQLARRARVTSLVR